MSLNSSANILFAFAFYVTVVLICMLIGIRIYIYAALNQPRSVRAAGGAMRKVL